MHRDLQRGEEGHQVAVLVPRRRAIAIADCASLERLGFHFEVDLGVSVRRFERDVAKPRADGVDVDAGTQQVDGRSVTAMSSETFAIPRPCTCSALV